MEWKGMNDKIQYLRVAVCDGDEKRIIQIEELLEKLGKEEGIQIDVDTMCKGRGLAERMLRMETYDIIYMGMNLEDADGIALAKSVRERDEELYMFFLGTEEKRLGELFEMMPAANLDVPVSEEEFRRWFKKAVARFMDQKRYFSFNFNRRTFHIPYHEIQYLESEKHCIRIKTIHQWYCYYGKMDEAEKYLEETIGLFIRIHKSYLVNYRYIYWMDGTSVNMDDGIRLPVSATYRKQARTKYWENMEKERRNVVT